MQNDDKKKTRQFRNTSIIILEIVVFFAFASYYFISLGLNNKLFTYVNYKSTDKSGYKVYLNDLGKEFYKTEYLDSAAVFSNGIDYIDVDFDYNVNFDKKITATYIYSIIATSSSDINRDGKSDWDEEVVLVEDTVKLLQDVSEINIKDSVNIDYKKFDERFKNFKETLAQGVSIDGELDIRLKLEIKGISSDDLDETQNIVTYSSFKMPLSERVIDVKMTKTNKTLDGNFEKEEILTDLKYMLYLIIGIVFGVLALILVVIFIRDYINLVKGRSEYTRTLKKILTTYDGIIVSTNSIPKFKDFKVVHVNSMQELLDAHGEVRMPINFIEVEPGMYSLFVLINNEMAWVYELKDENYKKTSEK